MEGRGVRVGGRGAHGPACVVPWPLSLPIGGSPQGPIGGIAEAFGAIWTGGPRVEREEC